MKQLENGIDHGIEEISKQTYDKIPKYFDAIFSRSSILQKTTSK
jgi:hypothetical protein